jgi:DNA-binding NarL/FixJ family response regulator
LKVGRLPERDVLDLLAAGSTNRQIANALAIADKTVRNHLSAVFLSHVLSG